ncbi:MAG: DUF3313 domain-containing protein [Syntrophorhabdaceae bacterium]|nr:DUF3313 domain-containing protein [Syntrophorhabdaceae bacterium]
MNKKMLSFMLIISIFFFTGCASRGIKPSGFLSRYDSLKEDSEYRGLFWWEKDGNAFKRYKRLMIDPVEVIIDKARSQREMSQEEKESLAKKLREYVIDAVKDGYPVVDRPAEDVLRIKSAITHLKPVNPGINIAATVILCFPIDAGEVTVEAQFMDSLTGEVLGELVAENRMDLIKAATKVWTRWSQVEATFRDWAKILRNALDETHK